MVKGFKLYKKNVLKSSFINAVGFYVRNTNTKPWIYVRRMWIKVQQKSMKLAHDKGTQKVAENMRIYLALVSIIFMHVWRWQNTILRGFFVYFCIPLARFLSSPEFSGVPIVKGKRLIITIWQFPIRSVTFIYNSWKRKRKITW